MKRSCWSARDSSNRKVVGTFTPQRGELLFEGEADGDHGSAFGSVLDGGAASV